MDVWVDVWISRWILWVIFGTTHDAFDAEVLEIATDICGFISETKRNVQGRKNQSSGMSRGVVEQFELQHSEDESGNLFK